MHAKYNFVETVFETAVKKIKKNIYQKEAAAGDNIRDRENGIELSSRFHLVELRTTGTTRWRVCGIHCWTLLLQFQ